MKRKPHKLWWTASEIADASLADMPRTKRGVNVFVKQGAWRGTSHARKRKGRGGGWEYHYSLFPQAARKALLMEAGDAKPQAPQKTSEELWAWFEALPNRVQKIARDRLHILQFIEAMTRDGHTKFMAAQYASQHHKITERTIWNWFELVEYVDQSDWLPTLAPRHRGAKRQDKRATYDPQFFEYLKGDYLRLERPSFASAYRRAVRVAKHNGWAYLVERTARRVLNERVPRVSQILAREGDVGLSRCFPPQTRDKSGMFALDGVNADCHKIDIFVNWPNEEKPIRPQIIAFQDIYSAKIISWRVDVSPNKVAVMAAFKDMLEFGLPNHCTFDNGTEFANKWLTGGVKTRFRYKIKDDDPLGVIPALGIELHWAKPASGQSKPIERAFRDVADDIAKDPRFAGAYVGNKPDAKPENYGSRAVPFEDFLFVLNEGIEEHNARAGRRSAVAQGRSFDEVFAKSYAQSPIRKVTEAQKRLCLMAQEIRTLNRSHGLVKIFDNEYWSDWMNAHGGKKVIVRFDAEDLHAGVEIYALNGEYMGHGAIKVKSAFYSLTDAQEHASILEKRKRAEKKYLKELRRQSAVEVAAQLTDATRPNEKPALEAKIVRPEFSAKQEPIVKAPVYTPAPNPEDEAKQEAFVANFEAERALRGKSAPKASAEENFKRALELEDLMSRQIAITATDQKWLKGYQNTPEYRAQRMIYDDFKLGEVR